jgi:hypothetical protein
MSELADFLLARIVEDEQRARELQAAYDRDEVRPPGRLVNLFALVVPSHVLAECEAKRQIIDWTQGWRIVPFTGDSLLRCLALPYADHPDFRPEWRP